MINAIAIDDEPKALEVIKYHASKIPYLQLVASFTNPFAGLEYLNAHKIDLVFLDITMPDISGTDLAKIVKGDSRVIIFTTAHSEYAVESYDLDALDYLLKPFEFARFLKSVQKAHEHIRNNSISEKSFFFVNSGFEQRRVQHDSILYIEGDGNYITFHTTEGSVIVRSSLKDLLDSLPPRYFIQAHRSFIVSLTSMKGIKDNHVLVGNARIPIGASYKEELMRAIKAF